MKSLCIFVSGLALGWLVGLSISPVIQVVLTSIVSIVVALSSALAGLIREEAEPSAATKFKRLPISSFNPIPIMFMVLGLAIGSSAGIYARSHNWFGTSAPSITSEWKDTGLSEQEISRRVFDSTYPPSPALEAKTTTTQANTPVEELAREQKREGGLTSSKNPQKEGETIQQRAQVGVLFTDELKQCKRLLNIDEEDELKREMASSSFSEFRRLSRICKTLHCLTSAVNRRCAKYK
jgi:hypothetical protein